MKKLLIFFASVLLMMGLTACQNEPIDISIDDAFALMNTAIEDYLSADSVDLSYSGEYRSTVHSLTDELEIKMKRMNKSSMVAIIDVTMDADDTYQTVETHYQDGIAYYHTSGGASTDSKIKEEKTYEAFKALYMGFIKATLKSELVRDVSILTSSSEITVILELASGAIEATLYVLPAMTYAKIASLEVTFTEKGVLKSLDVEYEGLIDSVYGVFSYHVTFNKINRYVIVPTLSSLEISDYQEADDANEASS